MGINVYTIVSIDLRAVDRVLKELISYTSLYCIILYRRLDVNVFQNWILIEHEVMGPKLTQAEGFVLGVGAKMFTIAGPVIVYGVSASVIYGIIYWLCTIM